MDKDKWYNKGLELLKAGNCDDAALNAFNKAIELDPKESKIWCRKGVALDRLGRWDEALKSHEKAIELNPSYANAWYNKAAILEQLGRYSLSLETYKKTLELQPDDADAWYNCALIYAMNNDKENILICLSKAIEFDKSYKEKAKKEEKFSPLIEDKRFQAIIE